MWFFSIVLSMAKSFDSNDWFSFDMILKNDCSESAVVGNCVLCS